MDEQGARCILRRLGDGVPASIDIRAFAADLDSALVMWAVLDEVKDDALRKRRARYRDRVTKAARRLKELLNDKEHGAWFHERIAVSFMRRGSKRTERTRAVDESGKPIEFIARSLDPAATLARFKGDLEKLINIAPEKSTRDSRRGKDSRKIKPFNFEKRSHFEALVGHALAEVYRSHFERPPGASVSRSGKPGPYVRFVMATLAVEGIVKSNGKPYEASSVVAAWKKARIDR